MEGGKWRGANADGSRLEIRIGRIVVTADGSRLQRELEILFSPFDKGKAKRTEIDPTLLLTGDIPI